MDWCEIWEFPADKTIPVWLNIAVKGPANSLYTIFKKLMEADDD